MPNITEMQRELIAYAHDEMFNRGLEAAARIVDKQAARSGHKDLREVAKLIRAQKVDPTARLSDWFGKGVALEPDTVDGQEQGGGAPKPTEEPALVPQGVESPHER